MVYRVLPFSDFWLDWLNPGYRLNNPSPWQRAEHWSNIEEIAQAIRQGEIELELFQPYWYKVHCYVKQAARSTNIANHNLLNILSASQGRPTPDLSRALEDILDIQDPNPSAQFDSADYGLLLSARLLQVDCILSVYDRQSIEDLRAENPVLQKGYVVPVVDLPELLRIVRSRKAPVPSTQEIYVFDRDDRRKLLPQGATVIDFAYAIHTKVGHKCKQARINGYLCPPETRLQPGDRVEILKGSQDAPSLSWLSLAVTNRAKRKIEQWHRLQQMKQLITLGQEILHQQVWPNLKLQGKRSQKWLLAKITQTFNLKSTTDLLHALGKGHLTGAQVLEACQRELRKKSRQFSTATLFQDLSERQIKFCQHCNPLPVDPLIGTTRSPTSLIRLHREDCSNLRNIDPVQQKRLSWEQRFGTVDLRLQFTDRPGALHQLQNHLLEAEGITLDIRRVITGSDPKLCPEHQPMAVVEASVDISRSGLNTVLKHINQTSGVEVLNYRSGTIDRVI